MRESNRDRGLNMDEEEEPSFRSQRTLAVIIFQLEHEVLKWGNSLTAEKAKEINDDLDRYYEEFVGKQLDLMHDTNCVEELSGIIEMGKKVQNKVIYLQTKLNKVLNLDDQSVRDTLLETPGVDSHSLFKKQEVIIERMESLALTADDLGADEAEVMANYLTSLYQLFISNQLKMKKYVDGANIDTQFDISENILREVTKLLAKLKKSSKKNELAEPVQQSELIDDWFEMFETRRSLISQIESLEMEKFDNAVEAATLNDRLNQINDSFISIQTKIETLIRGTEAQRRQFEIDMKIRQKITSIRKRLEEVSNSSNSIEIIKTDCDRVKQTILDALFKIQRALITQIEWVESAVNVDNAAEAAALIDLLTQIYASFASNQTKIETRVRGSSAHPRQLGIERKICQKIASLRERLEEVKKSASDMKIDSEQFHQLVSFFKFQQSLIAKVKSLKAIKVSSAAEAIAILNSLPLTSGVFISNQRRILAQVSGTDAERRQIEIDKKIRWKISSLRERLEEVSKFSNDTETNRDQVEPAISNALMKIQQSLGAPIRSLKTVRFINAIEAAKIIDQFALIYESFDSNQTKSDARVCETNAEHVPLVINEMIDFFCDNFVIITSI